MNSQQESEEVVANRLLVLLFNLKITNGSALELKRVSLRPIRVLLMGLCSSAPEKRAKRSDISVSNYQTSYRLEGAENTWFQVVEVWKTNSNELVSCELTQSAGLALLEKDFCEQPV